MAQPEGKKNPPTNPGNSPNPLQANEGDYGEKYKEHLLQQYLLYVGTANEVSSRRALANAFFLSVSTILVSIAGVVLANALGQVTIFDATFMVVFAGASILFSATWYYVIRSYDQLNTGKFNIIHKLEKVLPATLFTSEWVVLGGGKDPSKYRPISRVEARVPLIFIGVYVFLAISLILVYLHSAGLLAG